MSIIFDDFLIYVETKVNKDYYNKFNYSNLNKAF